MKDKIKVGFCIAYDWYLLEYSLPLVYDASDEICLSIDVNRTSWSGLRYSFDEEGFRELVSRIDKGKKIRLLEENFYDKSLSPMQNEVRQRNRMAAFLGEGGWHIQLDCDEYFVDYKGFIKYLEQLPKARTSRVNVCCAWIVLYKKTENGFLYVNPERKDNLYFIQVASRHPNYEHGRRNGDFNICAPFYLVHQSWARSSSEILEKVENWGHSNEFDSKSYFDKWNIIDENNYAEVRNFHPTEPELFPSLCFEKGKTIPELLKNIKYKDLIFLSPFELLIRNSRWISRLKKLVRMIKV
jgi:hypothetical protein